MAAYSAEDEYRTLLVCASFRRFGMPRAADGRADTCQSKSLGRLGTSDTFQCLFLRVI